MHTLTQILIEAIQTKNIGLARKAWNSIIHNKDSATIYAELSTARGQIKFNNTLLQATLLQAVIVLGQKWNDIACALIEHVDIEQVSSSKNTALHLAAETGNSVVTTQLIAKKANVNAKDSYDFTPLHRASLNNHTYIMELLLLNGADKNARAKPGLASSQTSLYLAAFNGQLDAVEVLLKAGAKPNAKIPGEQPPIYGAAISNSAEIIELLHQFKADIHTHVGGTTPLHLAAMNTADKALMVLLKLGADITSTDKNGHTTLNLANKVKASIDHTLEYSRRVSTPELTLAKKRRRANAAIVELLDAYTLINTINTPRPTIR